MTNKHFDTNRIKNKLFCLTIWVAKFTCWASIRERTSPTFLHKQCSLEFSMGQSGPFMEFTADVTLGDNTHRRHEHISWHCSTTPRPHDKSHTSTWTPWASNTRLLPPSCIRSIPLTNIIIIIYPGGFSTTGESCGDQVPQYSKSRSSNSRAAFSECQHGYVE